MVVTRDRVSGSPIHTLVRIWDSDRPDTSTIVASTTGTNSSFAYDSVTLPAIANGCVAHQAGRSGFNCKLRPPCGKDLQRQIQGMRV